MARWERAGMLGAVSLLGWCWAGAGLGTGLGWCWVPGWCWVGAGLVLGDCMGAAS